MLADGAYCVDTAVSRNATSVTYRAHDVAADRTVAITEFFPRYARRRPSDQKITTHPSSTTRLEGEMEDFRRDGRVLATLEEASLIPVQTILEENGTVYLVSEYLDGESLAAELARRGEPFPEEDVYEVAQDVCDALEQLHARDLLHLDVRPTTIFRRRDGGIVLLTRGTSGLDAAEAGTWDRSSDCYAPMEQILRSVLGTQLTPAADVYSLAVSLVELLAGHPPPPARDRLVVAGVDLVRVMGGQTPSPPVCLDEIFPMLPVTWVRTLEAALAFYPSSRTQTARELMQGLERAYFRRSLIPGPPPASSPPPPSPLPSPLPDQKSWAELEQVVMKGQPPDDQKEEATVVTRRQTVPPPPFPIEQGIPSALDGKATAAPDAEEKAPSVSSTPPPSLSRGVLEPISQAPPGILTPAPLAPLLVEAKSSPEGSLDDIPTPVPATPIPEIASTDPPPAPKSNPPVRAHPSTWPSPVGDDDSKRRIECSSCGWKFVVSREKVTGKDFKMRCKTCGAVFVVRALKDEEDPPDDDQDPSTGQELDPDAGALIEAGDEDPTPRITPLRNLGGVPHKAAARAINGPIRERPLNASAPDNSNRFHVYCALCGKLHSVPRDRVVNRLFQFTCKRCGEVQVVKGPSGD